MPRTLSFILALAALASCTKVPGTDTADKRDRQGVIAPAPAPAPTATVTLTSVTFGDDCGGAAPAQAPAVPARRAPSSAADMARPATRACNQTSMQLSVGANRTTNVRIHKVEVVDETGTSLGELVASRPTRWSDTSASYEAWDEKVTANQTALVSYVLSQPGFINRYDSHDRMYTVKVTAAVGGVTQTLHTTVMVVAQHAPMPT